MDITVILCTYNRCSSLGKALESVAASKLPRSIRWEVLVVDNNSRDRTREVVEDFSRRYPGRFRYLFEPQSGKSHALNAGIREATGDILAFMDDDVVVDAAWLQNLTAELRTGQWIGAGGRILPPPDFIPPSWLPLDGSYAMTGILAFFDLGPNPGVLTLPPVGTNMAFRKTVFEKHGGFHTGLGPRPGSEIRGEDTEFGQRLFDRGERLRWEPSAVVYHPVPEARLNKRYFLKWRFDFGRGLVLEMPDRPPVCGISRSYFSLAKTTYKLAIRAVRWLCTWNSSKRFYLKTFVWMYAGAAAEFYQRGRREQKALRLGRTAKPVPVNRDGLPLENVDSIDASGVSESARR